MQGRLSEFFRIMAAKTLEKSVSLTDSDVQTFLEGKENQNTEKNIIKNTKEKPKVTYSVALVMVFRQLKYLPQADLYCIVL